MAEATARRRRKARLTIAPLGPVVTVTTGQTPPTVQFTASVGGTPTGVAWGIDRGEIGTISASGLFTPTGTLGGTGNITAVYGGEKATTTVTVNILTTQQGDPAWTALDGGTLDAGAGGYRASEATARAPRPRPRRWPR